MSVTSYETLTQPIQERAVSDPQSPVLIFLHDDESVEMITAAEFHLRAGQYARAFQAAGVQKEDLVILVLRHSTDLLFAFWGALYLGAIGSIFPFLTEKLDPVLYRERVKELVTHSKAKVVITFPEFRDELSALLAQAGCRVLSTNDVLSPALDEPLDFTWPRFSSDKTAFLQHSSGTTGLQKGVALSHRAVLNQIGAYSQAINLRRGDVVVSWLPLYHDMGLIAGFVMPLVCGALLVLMSPFKWVRDPKLLFQAIREYHGSLCWLPNFAYNHSARAIRAVDLQEMDLSSMRAFINCSEPVYWQSQQLFAEKFAACGLKEEMLSTCYAMAENTFAVTQPPLGEAARVDWVNTRLLQEERRAVPAPVAAEGSKPIVSCGVPIPGTQIRVLGEQGEWAPDRRVGEIAIRSDCMLSGYYRRPDLTSEVLQAGWYHTGDMGYLAEGELFITGRKKDLIIVGGKNIYPQDLEAIANQVPGLVPGRSAAFGLYDESLGSENIVMVCELEKAVSAPEQKAIEMELRRRVVMQSEVAVSDVRLVQKRWLIKTSSGKISRSANREKYIQKILASKI